jgi:hypothetical protein
MKQEKEAIEKNITDCRSVSMPYAEERRKLIEAVRDKEKNLQHILVSSCLCIPSYRGVKY